VHYHFSAFRNGYLRNYRKSSISRGTGMCRHFSITQVIEK